MSRQQLNAVPAHPYLVKSGALRLVLNATGAAAAIGLAIELHGLRKASAQPLPRGFA